MLVEAAGRRQQRALEYLPDSEAAEEEQEIGDAVGGHAEQPPEDVGADEDRQQRPDEQPEDSEGEPLIRILDPANGEEPQDAPVAPEFLRPRDEPFTNRLDDPFVGPPITLAR